MCVQEQWCSEKHLECVTPELVQNDCKVIGKSNKEALLWGSGLQNVSSHDAH